MRQWNDCRYSNLPHQGPHILVQCTAVNIRFLLIKYKEGTTNGFIQLAEVSCVTNTHTECHSSTSETEKTTSWMLFSRWESIQRLLLQTTSCHMGSDLVNEATIPLLVIQSHRILFEQCKELFVVCVLALTEKRHRFICNWIHVQNIWLECM